MQSKRENIVHVHVHNVYALNGKQVRDITIPCSQHRLPNKESGLIVNTWVTPSNGPIIKAHKILRAVF